MERWRDGEMGSNGCHFAGQRLHRYSLFPFLYYKSYTNQAIWHRQFSGF
ncbi:MULTISPECIES: hypothetical protein [unclassified Moorena]|nr:MULTISPECIES: hypothetical protein [unclassified Moorena]NEO11453.1 hypothetical protein [Moorena sp. SIO3E8]NEP97913.1 hypothetical protein [Moorena sp. SIO3F7]